MKVKRILAIALVLCMLTSIFISSSLTAYADDETIERGLGALEDGMVSVLDSSASDFPCDTEGENLPSSVDLSTSVSFPSVGDQLSNNSCVTWATVYYQFGYQVAAMNGWDAKTDTTKQFSPKFVYNMINAGLDFGTTVPKAYDLLSVSGAVRYSEFIPTGIGSESEYLPWCTDIDALRNALRYRISSYKKYSFSSTAVSTPINSYNDSSLNKMKSLLNNGFPLVYTTDNSVWDNKNRLSSLYNSSHINEYVCLKQVNSDAERKGHAMTIVGYDDNIQYDLSGDGNIQDYEKGAFKVVNSWGTKYYGNSGFMWVMYDALNAVSNTSTQNSLQRTAIFENYSYYVITVEEYPLDLVAEVTLTMTKRNQAQMELGLSSINSTVPQQEKVTSLLNSGGSYNFAGIDTTVQTATFPFDFGTLVHHPTVWKNYYIKLNDKDESEDSSLTVIDKIKIIDSSGKSVVNDTNEKTISGTTGCYRYMLGMVGDIDNNGSVTIVDTGLIQQYSAGLVTLTDAQQKVADVTGEGDVNTMDATSIQMFLAGLIDVFDNGMYARLD